MFKPRRTILGWRSADRRRKVGRIKIVLPCNADQGEQGIAAGVGEGGSEPVGRCRLADRADRPIGRDPLPRGVNKRRGEPDQAAVAVNSGGLNRCDLVLAEALADQVEPGGERGIAKGPAAFARKRRDDGCSEGLLRVCNLGLGLGKRRRKRPNPIAGVLHDWPPQRAVQN